jgi:peptidyl-prolyl cis-trans isomerase C
MRKEHPVHSIRFLAITLICVLALFGVALHARAQDSTQVTKDASGGEDAVLAKVNDHPIKRSDVEHLHQQLKDSGALRDFEPTEAQLVEELIRRESIRRYVLDNEIEVAPEAIDKRWKEMEERIAAAGTTLDEVLKEQHLTKDELREIVYVQLALNKLAEAKLTQEDLALVEEEVRARHILVAVPQSNPTEEDYAKAKEKILAIKAEIDAGKPFEEAAAEYSDCPSKAHGGDLGYFPRKDAMVEPFAEAAYALKVGEVSRPVRTQFGYHLIKVIDRSKEPAKQQLLDIKIAGIIQDISDEVKVERFYKGAPDEKITPDEAGEGASSDTGE